MADTRSPPSGACEMRVVELEILPVAYAGCCSCSETDVKMYQGQGMKGENPGLATVKKLQATICDCGLTGA